MDLVIQLLLNGVVNGSHYALLGLGFGLIFATTRIVHFAFGSVFTFGAYVAWFVSGYMEAPIILGLAAGVAVAMALGVASYVGLYQPLERRGVSPLIPLIASLGLTIVLENLVGIIFGTGARTIGVETSVYFLGPAFFTSIHIWQVASFLLVCTLLYLFVSYTRYGKAIVAMTDDPEMARVIGIDTTRVSILVFALGSAISAIAALLVTLKDGASTHMGFTAVFMGFVAVIVGGVGSMRGAIAGGFLLGLVESLGLWKISTEWQSSIAFIVLFLMILLRPHGLFSLARR